MSTSAGFKPLDLALGKNFVMAVLSSLGAAISEAATGGSSVPGNQTLGVGTLLLILWLGFGPGAMASSLQTYAQSYVSATTAQV